MFDWIGSLRIRERSARRVVLGLSAATRAAGGLLLAVGLALAPAIWSISPWLSILPLALAGLGALLVTLRRDLTIDRASGVLRVEQRVFGLGSKLVVPLFHLRAVVVANRGGLGLFEPSGRFVAYVERRIGEAIYLDEARRCAGLLELAEAIADVAEVRLEYDARAANDG